MNPRGLVLMADDEERILKTLARALREEGHEVVTVRDGNDAARHLSERAFDVFVVDHRMPGRTGLELIAGPVAALPESERPLVLMMTAHASVGHAIEAMKAGAFDYLQKPFEVEELLVAVRRALERQRLERERLYLLHEREEEFDHYGIVGRSQAMQEVLRRIERVAATRSTVLVTGETGTGKELVARAIHDHSAQRKLPLIKVNCAAIPETLLESELFGHVKGAFSGAVGNKKGRFALADGSTIFLDEVGALAPAVQAKLLRVLQEREFEPLGAERTQKVDLRVVAATNRDLAVLVAEDRFQADLFYRLSVIPIALPPLRTRRDDIAVLAEHFRVKHVARVGRPVQGIAPAALDVLRGHDWPGNVRELENVIERAIVLARGDVIDLAAISPLGGPSSVAASLPHTELHANVEWAERESVERALRRAGGVKKDAAQILGLSQRALSYYLRKYTIDQPGD